MAQFRLARRQTAMRLTAKPFSCAEHTSMADYTPGKSEERLGSQHSLWGAGS